ncbi:N-acetyltransferase [Candidatus Dojkabacteria bacterium]|uniref:N-acetyltransferase n=1 Tax=Candidatus Dojkabacteria bacterium TaxID=2099670 RepID=A0A955L829_9BACT|nr:N-acetyltransferase [Candidatus Dojkabacteria bacterium]
MQNNPTTYIDPTAIIDEGAQIGEDSKIWHFSHIMDSARIGNKCSIGQGCFVAGILGSGCKLQNNVNVYEGVTLGNNVFCGPNMTFTNDLNPRAEYPKKGNYTSTIVKDGVTFGAQVVVICGVTIGNYALIGAGSVITKDVPNYALIYGNPGTIRGWVSEHGEPLDFDDEGVAVCKKSGENYRLDDGIVTKILN